MQPHAQASHTSTPTQYPNPQPTPPRTHLCREPSLWVCLDPCKHLCHHDQQLTRRAQLAQVAAEVLTTHLRAQHTASATVEQHSTASTRHVAAWLMTYMNDLTANLQRHMPCQGNTAVQEHAPSSHPVQTPTTSPGTPIKSTPPPSLNTNMYKPTHLFEEVGEAHHGCFLVGGV